jgi:hypothetical protein
MNIKVEEVNVNDYRRETVLQSSIFLSESWLCTIAADVGQPVFFRFLINDEIIGLLGGLIIPYKNKRQQLFFYSGPAVKNNDPLITGQCLQVLYNYASTTGRFERIILRSYDWKTIPEPLPPVYHATHRQEYILNLTEEPSGIIQALDPEIRRLARKAEKEEVTIHESTSPENVDQLFALLDSTYRIRQDKGYGDYDYFFLPFITAEKLKALLRNGNALILYAKKNNETISMQFIIHHNQKAYGLLMGNNGKAYKTGATSLIFREGLQILQEKGFIYYNLGGVQQGKNHIGLMRFKKKLNPKIISSVELETNFLGLPMKIFNPLLSLKRHLENEMPLPWMIKKRIIQTIKTRLG